MVANNEDMCTQVLASKLDKPFVNYIPHGPSDPLLTTLYPNSNRRTFIPLPLSYLPLGSTVNNNQHLVSSQLRHGCYLAWCSHPSQHCKPATFVCNRISTSENSSCDTLWHAMFEYIIIGISQ